MGWVGGGLLMLALGRGRRRGCGKRRLSMTSVSRVFVLENLTPATNFYPLKDSECSLMLSLIVFLRSWFIASLKVLNYNLEDHLTKVYDCAHFIKTKVTVNNNSPIQDYVHPDDQTQPFEMTPRFKPFTIKQWDVTNKVQDDQHFWSVKTYQTIVIFFIVRKTFSYYYAMRSKLINTAGRTFTQLSFTPSRARSLLLTGQRMATWKTNNLPVIC